MKYHLNKIKIIHTYSFLCVIALLCSACSQGTSKIKSLNLSPIEQEFEAEQYSTCLGDFDQDEMITEYDLDYLDDYLGESIKADQMDINLNPDINLDGIVDTKDELFVQGHIGACQGAIYPKCQDLDLDADGIIGAADLLVLLRENTDVDKNGVSNSEDSRILAENFGCQ